LNFLRAGARVVITASYQASYESFATAGLPASDADFLLASSVTLAQAARATWQSEQPTAPPTLVAASLGPYGAMLAGGQEYTGDYDGADLQQLKRFHRPRMTALLGADPDLLAWETIPNLLEAEAIAALQTEFDGPTGWVSFQCRDASRLADGSTIEEAVRLVAKAPGVEAVGFNCTAPEHALELIERIRGAAPKLAIVVYPNDGRVWDGLRREWATGGAGGFPDDVVRSWAAAGADLIGGCCGVTPAGVTAIAHALRS
ncbi:MAG: homocysteine S-methyltransferase, partial [Thermoleophilia bacterium]|nr:homocysteine S-methyltransferase [Thermoleophilia bacterium]